MRRWIIGVIVVGWLIGAYFVTQELACLWWEAGTDTCVGCTDDCLDGEEAQR